MNAPVPLPDPPSAAAAPPPALPASPFLAILVRQIRAHDLNGSWETQSDAELLQPFVLTREQRRRIPIIADPDRRVVWRLEQFYSAVALAAEQPGGILAQPMLKLSHEGYGRVVLIAGRLVALRRTLRDVHRFGFPSLAALAAEGDGLAAEARAMIARFPDVARL